MRCRSGEKGEGWGPRAICAVSAARGGCEGSASQEGSLTAKDAKGLRLAKNEIEARARSAAEQCKDGGLRQRGSRPARAAARPPPPSRRRAASRLVGSPSARRGRCAMHATPRCLAPGCHPALAFLLGLAPVAFRSWRRRSRLAALAVKSPLRPKPVFRHRCHTLPCGFAGVSDHALGTRAFTRTFLARYPCTPCSQRKRLRGQRGARDLSAQQTSALRGFGRRLRAPLCVRFIVD